MRSRREIAFLLLAGTGCAPAPQRRRPAPTAEPPQGIDRQLFEAVNRARRDRGVPELEWHSGAASVAVSHSRAMADRRFFSHSDPQRGDLSARINDAGIRWTRIAENLFQQQGCPDAIGCAVDGWLKSDGHRRNMLNPEYTHSGVGVSSDSRGTLYYTQVFLTPA